MVEMEVMKVEAKGWEAIHKLALPHPWLQRMIKLIQLDIKINIIGRVQKQYIQQLIHYSVLEYLTWLFYRLEMLKAIAQIIKYQYQ